MKFKNLFFKISFVFICLWSIFSFIYFGKKVYQKYQNHKIQNAKNEYVKAHSNQNTNTQFLSKIISCNQKESLNYLNSKNHFLSEKATEGTINQETIDEFSELYLQWDERLKSFCDKHILQIYIVKNLSSTARASQISDSTFVIFVNEFVLNTNANDWLSNKENSLIDFENQQNIQFKHLLESEENNNAARLLEYVLIHEIGHCVGVVKNITRDFNGNYQYKNFLAEEFKISYLKSERKQDILHIDYYKNSSSITFKDYLNLLKIIENSSYPTTYSTIDELEYFAEYFAAYVHCILQNRPFVYQIFDNEELILTLENGILKERNKNKIEFFEKLFTEL
jgi:hypothetical protein